MRDTPLNKLEKGFLAGALAAGLTGISGVIIKKHYNLNVPEIIPYALMMGGLALNLIGASLQNTRISREYKNRIYQN